ncbi:hypothetical protein Q8A67_024529 [Cirrhinus molitorella]|uniref:Uncharacterized protein n=1 Tax=Cirrhinus molitorella TaxID=172907 RepID=A0AA88TAJ7_9TELE|nr:hypothetical protein Q8A67_024529 [Cirrhinus molitorella]
MSPVLRQRRKVSAQTEVRVRAHPPLWSRAGQPTTPSCLIFAASTAREDRCRPFETGRGDQRLRNTL